MAVTVKEIHSGARDRESAGTLAMCSNHSLGVLLMCKC